MRARKIDANQRQIVKTLRSVPGVTVAVGHDDILVGRHVDGIPRTFWFEIKRPARVSRKQASQVKLAAEWRGHYQIVSTLDEILTAIGLPSLVPWI
ncbi:MAG: hypothetical protein ACYCOR_17965 [Acidobacteriaceae bacterium]